MKSTELQKKICDVIIEQANFWKSTNDITSPTHLCDIDETIDRDLLNEISDAEREELSAKIGELYWLIRKFDETLNKEL